MAEPIVKTTALEKYYKTGTQLVKALDGVDFEVKEREFVAIIGKSGSGKTTLLHMLGGLDTPTSGSVTVGGAALETLDNDRLAVFRRRKVGFIFQQYNLIPDLNVYDNILFPLELDGARINRKFIDYLLETLHISSKKEMLPSMLSGGEQQRVAIIRALAARPAIVLADEPTASCIYTQKGNKKIRKPQAANQTALIFDRRAAARLLSINSIRRLCWS